MEYVELFKLMMVDVVVILYDLCKYGKDIMFEGVQGLLLDIDYGIYFYVISFNIIVGGIVIGFGFGLLYLDYVLGIIKVYIICVGFGLFLIELFDDVGVYLVKCGYEFGVIIGCVCCCGWFDVVILCCVIEINSIFGLCLIKFDVFDGLDVVCLCVGYKNVDGDVLEVLIDVDSYIGLQLVYEEMFGWSELIVGVKILEELLVNVCVYIKCVEELVGVLIDIIFIGLDCNEIIILCYLFV